MPGRPSPVIRVPERERNRPESRSAETPAASPSPAAIIYVNSAGCKYSMELLHDIQNVYNIPVSVVDVAKSGNIPPWLRGTPSIVVGTDVYCGDTAFMYVESLSHRQSQPARPDQSSVQDIVSGKGRKNDNMGCGLSAAFCAPPQISEEEASRKYSGSVDDAMARLMQNRG
jgi:hypothetical protein